jgi:DNA transformation protein
MHERRNPQLPLAAVKNIGAVTAGRLDDVGVRTLDQLEALGPIEAYRRVKAKYPRETTLVCLYALQGALWDVHWNDLPPEVKAQLKAQVAGP